MEDPTSPPSRLAAGASPEPGPAESPSVEAAPGAVARPAPVTPVPASPWTALEPRLACPACGEALELAEQRLVGRSCSHAFPIDDGIARLAIHGTTETWGDATEGPTSEAYQDNYQEVTEAGSYNRSYRTKPLKRLTTWRELRLLERLLGSQPRAGVLLDLPAGGGRLSGPFARHTDLLVEADIAVGQLRYGQQAGGTATMEARMTASAFHVPFADRGVDGAVSIRLCHHLPTPDERARLLGELMRVSDRFVIVTFFDFRSLKNLLRRARRPFDGKAPKHTMKVEEVAELARARGFELVACPALSWIGSGHRYALLVRREGA